ncbi:MAG: alpha/beta hydrolase [Anaerolineae bacterium]|nr:alpha/beta hydrolase [Anaerolineae bacterium]
MSQSVNLHEQQPVYHFGAPLNEAKAAMVMLHGRGGSPHDMLMLAKSLGQPKVAFLAPQALHNTWYPNRFIAPVASNEPWLTSALMAIEQVLGQISAAGLAMSNTMLLGFSQGACLALEYAARHPQRYGGVVGLSGALIENGDQPRDYSGSFADTPIFLGCSDVDFHIPVARVRRSAQLLQTLGANVTTRIYAGMGHEVNADELAWVQGRLIDIV